LSLSAWHTLGKVDGPLAMPDLDALEPATLKAMFLLQQSELLSHKTLIEHLQLLIAKLRRMQFGRSSEKIGRQIEQLELQLCARAPAPETKTGADGSTPQGCAALRQQQRVCSAGDTRVSP
jgi:hypothetical protein